MRMNPSQVARIRRTRRYRSPEERCRIVEETLVSGVSVATVAREHELNANLLFHWRKLYHAGLLRENNDAVDEQRMLPVTVSCDDSCPDPMTDTIAMQPTVASGRSEQPSTGSIELTLVRAKLRIVGAVDAAALRVAIECLLG